MDVFEAVDSRISCRWFLDKPVDPTIVKELIVKAQRAASGGNLQSWYVYALANEQLGRFVRSRPTQLARSPTLPSRGGMTEFAARVARLTDSNIKQMP
jgi:nitroreductase